MSHHKMAFKSKDGTLTVEDTDSNIDIPDGKFKKISLTDDVILSIKDGEINDLMSQDKVKYRLI